MSTYAVGLTNTLSNTQGTARVTSHGNCPRVRSVEIRGWAAGSGVDAVEAVVEFDPSDLTDEPIDVNLNVRVTAPALSDGRRGVLTDGHDGLRRWSQVNHSFDVRGEAYADDWAAVTEVEVSVSA